MPVFFLNTIFHKVFIPLKTKNDNKIVIDNTSKVNMIGFVVIFLLTIIMLNFCKMYIPNEYFPKNNNIGLDILTFIVINTIKNTNKIEHRL